MDLAFNVKTDKTKIFSELTCFYGAVSHCDPHKLRQTSKFNCLQFWDKTSWCGTRVQVCDYNFQSSQKEYEALLDLTSAQSQHLSDEVINPWSWMTGRGRGFN